MEQNVRAVTVEQLNTYIRDFLAGAPYLSAVTVKGELSNVRVYGASGHIYFTLKDEKSTIPATMFGVWVSPPLFSLLTLEYSI